eukprot:1282758-Rhodomonas_salina.2
MAGDKKKAWETFRQEVTQSCGPKAAARWIDDKTRPKGALELAVRHEIKKASEEEIFTTLIAKKWSDYARWIYILSAIAPNPSVRSHRTKSRTLAIQSLINSWCPPQVEYLLQEPPLARLQVPYLGFLVGITMYITARAGKMRSVPPLLQGRTSSVADRAKIMARMMTGTGSRKDWPRRTSRSWEVRARR